MQKNFKLTLITLNLTFTGLLTASWPRLVVQHHTMSWFSYFVPSVCQFFFTAHPALRLYWNPVNKVVKSLDYVITCAFLKIFPCNNPKVITDFKLFFGFDKMSDVITTRRVRFPSGLTKSTDLLKYLCKFLL